MAGFMAGFGTTLSQLIEEDRKYYRDAAAKRRDYIQTYGTRAVTERENKANAAKGVYNYLISNDISEEDARYVLNTSGVQGLAQLKATIDSRTDLTADERSNLVKKAKDYVDENPDEDINSVLKRAYGLYKSTDNPVKRERSMFASMLGLDSRMMEDEVLDDLYINGYTGRDIYRIMGSAEAQTGTALDLDLPSKPPSPTVLNNTAKFLESQFDTSITSRIEALKRSQLIKDKDGNSVASPDFDNIQDEITKLENLKAKGLLALGQYAAAYDPALFDFARAQEEALPGSITRNSYLFEFLPAYQTHFEEGEDEAKLAAAGDKTSEALGTTPGAGDGTGATPEPSNKVMEFATADEFNKAAAAGEIPSGAAVQIGDGQVQTFDLPDEKPKTTDLGDAPKPITFSTNIEDARALASELGNQGIEAYPVIKKDDDKDTVLVQIGVYETKEDAEAAYKKLKTTVNVAALASPFMAYPDDYEPIYEAAESGGKKFVRLRLQVPNKEPTDLGDMSGAPGFRERDDFNPKPELTVEDRINAKREATTQVAGAISDVAEDVSSKLKAFDNTLDVAAGNAMLGIRAKANTVLGALAQVSGNDELADSFYRVSVEAEDGTRKGVSFDQGLVDGLNQVLDDLGVPDYSEVKDMPEAVNQYVDDPNTEGRDLDADLGVGYEPATTRLFSTMDRLKKLRLAINEAPKDVTPEAVLEAVAKPDLGMEERIRDDARQFLQDEKSFPQPLPTVVIDDLADGVVDVVQNLIKNRQAPSERDVEALKSRLKSSQYRGPISDKTLKEKLDDIYNFYTQEDTEYSPRAIGTVGFQDLGLRSTADDVRYPRSESPDAQTKIRTPLGDTRSGAADMELPSSLTVEQMTTRGKKAKPSGLMSPQSSGAAPKLGQAEFGDLIDRVHGSSKAAEAFNNKVSSGKVKAADVTRLIKATRKLPNTKSKDKLLNSLFDLRDALNNR